MLFQQQMRLPVDSDMLTSDKSDEQAYDNKDKEDGEDVSKIIEQLLESRRKAFDKAEYNIECPQKKQKELYDRKYQPDELPDGSLLLLENTAQKQCKGGKLCPVWLGPYSVKPGWSHCEKEANISRLKANISRLKVYTHRDGKEPEDKEPEDKEKKDK